MRIVNILLIIILSLSSAILYAKKESIKSYQHTETFTYSTSINHGIEQTTFKAMQKCAGENGGINIFGVVQTSETVTNDVSEEFYNKYVSMLVRDTITSYKHNTEPLVTLNPEQKTFTVAVDLKLVLDSSHNEKHDIDFAAELNKSTFASLDKAWIEYRLSEPLYVLIAAVLEDSVSIWHYTTDKVEKNRLMRFPEEDGASFIMTLSDDKTVENGAFCFVASREMLPMALLCDKKEVSGEYVPKKLSIEQFYQCINSGDIELKLIPYVTKGSI